jgi:hypothetical protein
VARVGVDERDGRFGQAWRIRRVVAAVTRTDNSDGIEGQLNMAWNRFGVSFR